MNTIHQKTQKSVNKRVSGLLHFIKYNNFFVIMITAVFVIAGTTFAARPDIMVDTTEEIVSVDNSRILELNVRNFNPKPKIELIEEDDNTYYVTYTINNVAVEDYVWKDVVETKKIEIEKAALRGGDLGLYLTKQISEVVEAKIAFLKEVQKKEEERGQTNKVAAVIYSGIIGKYFDKEDKVFPAYTAVVREQKVRNPQNPLASNDVVQVDIDDIPEPYASSTGSWLTEDDVRQLIKDAIKKYLSNDNDDDDGGGSGNSGPNNEPDDPPVPDEVDPDPKNDDVPDDDTTDSDPDKTSDTDTDDASNGNDSTNDGSDSGNDDSAGGTGDDGGSGGAPASGSGDSGGDSGASTGE